MAEHDVEKRKRKTTTSTKVKRRYNDKVYARVIADLPKKLVADFKAAVKGNGTTTAEVLRQAMQRYTQDNPAKQEKEKPC